MVETYDVVIIHPPAFPNFREQPILPGPIDRTVPNYTYLFIMFPVGMMSIADYLDRAGFKVKVFNTAELLLKDRNFDFVDFLKKLEADLYTVGLHWCVHSVGAIEVAKLCKYLHPDSTVAMGGLTSTFFAEEIVRNFSFVDCVIRGEGEIPICNFMRNLKSTDKFKALQNTPNCTFRNQMGEVVSTSIHVPPRSLDELEFTRFDLVEPYIRTLNSPFTNTMMWNIPISRGCLMNCAGCGGSRTSYKVMLGRTMPAFRSPSKIYEDLAKLDELGVHSVFLFQDPRLGGQKYIDELFTVLGNANWKNIKNIGLELFWPASFTYLEKIKRSNIAEHVGLSISPESGNDEVRKAHGRIYTTSALMQTVENSVDLGIPIGVFFLISLGHESPQTLYETWSLWEKILKLNVEKKRPAKTFVDFGPMILLDPGSPAYFDEKRYGYKILFKNFIDFYENLKIPHWKFWINYETLFFDRDTVGKVILDSWEALSIARWKLGQLSQREYELDLLRVKFERTLYKNIDKILAKSPEEIVDSCKELVEISRDPFLTWTYVLAEEGE